MAWSTGAVSFAFPPGGPNATPGGTHCWRWRQEKSPCWTDGGATSGQGQGGEVKARPGRPSMSTVRAAQHGAAQLLYCSSPECEVGAGRLWRQSILGPAASAVRGGPDSDLSCVKASAAFVVRAAQETCPVPPWSGFLFASVVRVRIHVPGAPSICQQILTGCLERARHCARCRRERPVRGVSVLCSWNLMSDKGRPTLSKQS